VDLKEFVSGFVAEAEDHLRSIKANLTEIDAALRGGRQSPKAVRELFRSFHTIKGLAAMVSVEPIADIAHGVETVLRNADRAGGSFDERGLEAVLSATSAVERRLRGVAAGQSIEPAPETLLRTLSQLEATVPDSPGTVSLPRLDPVLQAKLTSAERQQIEHGARAGQRPLRVDFVPNAERAARGLTITTVRERVGALGEIVRVLPISVAEQPGAPASLRFCLILLTSATDEQVAEAAAAEPGAVVQLGGDDGRAPSVLPAADDIDQQVAHARVVRVPVERLDESLQHLSEVVVNHYRLERAVARVTASGADTRELAQVLTEQGRELKTLRAAILRLRMVDVAEILEPLPLLMRGLRAATNKEVRLEVERSDAELDKAVAERILPALVHLVRNAVDHAIEPADERAGLGKPREGLIRVRCRQRADSRLEIAVEDDGRGIDGKAVAARAGVGAPRSDEELLDLLARPGFSTKEVVTKTSGRGLGVDIVKRIVVGDLGGELLLSTAVGRGTTFTIRIPLTMTIVDVLTFECNAQPFVAPVSMIEEVIEIDPALLRRGPAPNRGGAGVSLVERRGEVIPLLSLTRALHLSDIDAPSPKALVVRPENAPFAFGVDRLTGQKEVVVRPMADPLVQVTGVSGSTDLGDGRPVLVLDLFALGRRAASRRAGVLS
jgi:two-component system chemotaxis sensor kinase CheA